MENRRLKESDLIIPVLHLMKLNKGIVTIRQIRDYILENYPLTEADLKMSETRRNEHLFEQQIRNLTSHNKLEKMGLAENIQGGFRLLPEILDLLENSEEWVFDIVKSGIKNVDIKKCISNIDKKRKIINFDEITNEGSEYFTTNVKKRVRSNKLRKAAIQYYSKDNMIHCDCCGFNFMTYYGDTYGAASCIEIHHKKPIFMYEDEDEQKAIRDAIGNLMPVCPNCHRVIHKHKLFTDGEVLLLKKEIEAARNNII